MTWVREVGGLPRLRRRTIAYGVACLIAGLAAGTILSLQLHPNRGSTTSSASSSPSLSTGIAFARQPAPPFTLTDQAGESVSLTAEKGHVVLLTFMDPQCTQLCPVIGKDIGVLEKSLPSWIHPVLLIVSVAPGRSAADVNSFLAKESPGWLPGWHWLVGPNEASLKLAWVHWHITVIPTAADIEHDALLDIIDPAGYLRGTFPAPLYVDDVVHAITTIAHA